jgi:hypothetical protein
MLLPCMFHFSRYTNGALGIYYGYDAEDTECEFGHHWL